MEALKNIDWVGLAGQVALAIAILVVTWIVAKVVKWIFGKLASKIPALQKAGNDGQSLGSSLGGIASMLVWLFGLVALLQVFGLSQVLAPIQSLLNGVFEFLPNIIGAGFVFFVGALLAKIVRQLIETALGALPFEKWTSKANAKVGEETGTASTEEAGAADDEPSALAAIPKTVATIVYALIMIIIAIAALQILGIESISGPATDMLNTIFQAIPNIIAAAIMLGIGVMIAKFAGDILGQILQGMGTDRALRDADILPADKSASEMLAKVAQVAIVLFFAVMAAKMLEFPQITTFLSEILELGGKVLFGAAVVAAGFFIANLLAKMASGTGATVIRYATIALFSAMGLKYMGIADSIIELAFGALVVGGAAAAALAFGLGGRDAAARQLESMSGRSSGGASRGTSSDPLGGSSSNPPWQG